MKIAVLDTGGTISCVGDPLAPMSATQFAAACRSLLDPILRQRFPELVVDYVTELVFPESRSGTLDSTNLQPSDWCRMAAYILDHYEACDGWVLLHGTDSMDFTGTALPFLLSRFDALGVCTSALSKPVILTGSQVPMFYQAKAGGELALHYDTDAFQNFCGAVAAAQLGIPEVCVYFDSHLFRGNRVLKTDAGHFDAFSSPNYPALGQLGVASTLKPENVLPPPVRRAVSLDDVSARAAAQAQLSAILAAIDDYPAMQLNAFPARYDAKHGTALLADLIRACVGRGIKGLVLESYGEGNFPSGNPDSPADGAIYQALAEADRAGVVIVDCTQVIRGVVDDSAYAAGAWLPAVGALGPADMTPTAAFAKLIVLLSAAHHNGWSQADVKTLMQLDLLGEMMSVSRLDSRGNASLLAGQSINALDGSATLRNDPRRGPILVKSGSPTPLWAAVADPPAEALPGRLVLQSDGNLVFYGRYDTPLWASETEESGGAASLLILGGSAAGGDLCLYVYDYTMGAVKRTLYAQRGAG